MYFDIGSNVGNWSLANSKQCDKIISIEASPTTFKKLVDNCKNDDNIILLNYAVCNNNGNDITFYQADCDTLSTINKEWLTAETSRFHNASYTEITCKTITIDVEGGEYECIRSLTQKVELLCFEWASETNTITLNCIDYLFTLGYTKYYIQMQDNYLFRPNDDEFCNIFTVKQKLSTTIPKRDWGMIWCK